MAIQRSIPELIRAELEELQMPAPASALRALAGVTRGERIPPERMGRILGYERERYLRTRQVPVLAAGLAIDGTPASPPWLGLGTWRLARRLVAPDARVMHAAALGVRICERALRLGADAAEELRPSALQASEVVLGSAAGAHLGSGEWEQLRAKLLGARPAGGTIGLTAMQHDAEARLEASGITEVARYFGAGAPLGAVHALGLLRQPLPGEDGEAFDDLVRRRAGRSDVAREVLAFVQEWGDLTDDLARPPTLTDYAERWHATEAEARGRLETFRRVLPGESDPGATWSLLWEGVDAQQRRGDAFFIRLTSVAVVDTMELPQLADYFLRSLHDQLGTSLGRKLRASRLENRLPARDEPLDGHRDLRRLYALGDCVLHRWVAEALLQRGSEAEARAARDLRRISDDVAAHDAQAWIGGLRHRATGLGLHQVLLKAQRCLRVCAELSPETPPTAPAPLLPGVRLAAGTLAAISQTRDADVVREAGVALDLLGAA